MKNKSGFYNVCNSNKNNNYELLTKQPNLDFRTNM